MQAISGGIRLAQVAACRGVSCVRLRMSVCVQIVCIQIDACTAVHVAAAAKSSVVFESLTSCMYSLCVMCLSRPYDVQPFVVCVAEPASF